MLQKIIVLSVPFWYYIYKEVNRSSRLTDNIKFFFKGVNTMNKTTSIINTLENNTFIRTIAKYFITKQYEIDHADLTAQEQRRAQIVICLQYVFVPKSIRNYLDALTLDELKTLYAFFNIKY